MICAIFVLYRRYSNMRTWQEITSYLIQGSWTLHSKYGGDDNVDDDLKSQEITNDI